MHPSLFDATHNLLTIVKLSGQLAGNEHSFSSKVCPYDKQTFRKGN